MKSESEKVSQYRSREKKELISLTPRVVILLALLTVCQAYIALSGPVWGVGRGAGIIGPINSHDVSAPSPLGLLVILIMALVSFRIPKVAKKLKLDFSRAELFALYAGITLMTAFVGFTFAFVFLGFIGYAPYDYMRVPALAQPLENIAQIMFVWDFDALDALHMGGASVPWGFWIVPLLMWSLIYCAFIFLLICVGSLFYERWSAEERLGFPLVVPPIALVDMVEGKAKDYSVTNRLLLLGVAITLTLRLPSILNHFFPVVPGLNVDFNLGLYFGGSLRDILAPWPFTMFRIWPFAIGMAYFAPTDFAFTFWFFYYIVARLGIGYISYATGVLDRGWTFAEYQFQGGYIAIALCYIWLGRQSMAQYIKAAFGKAEADAEAMPVPPRVLVFGGLAAIIFLLISGKVLLSIEPLMMLVGIFLLLSLAITFSRTGGEAAMPYRLASIAVPATWIQWFGSSSISKATNMGMRSVFNETSWPMTGLSAYFMEGMKLAQEGGMKRRSMTLLLMIAAALGLFVGLPLILRVYYQYGLSNNVSMWPGIWGRSFYAQEAFRESGPARYSVLVTAGSMLATALMMAMRTQFTWWPFHPLAYVTSMHVFIGWRFPSAFFIAWVIKVLANRYGGASLINTLKPLFIGMVLCDVIIMGIANIFFSLEIFVL